MAVKRKKNSISVSIMLMVGLMLVSFAGGMLAQKALSRTPQTDASLTYIEDIPVLTDYIPEGTRARPGQTREIKYLVIHETDNPGEGANAAAHNSLFTRTPTPRRASFRGTTRWTITRSTTICRTRKPPITRATAWRRTAAT